VRVRRDGGEMVRRSDDVKVVRPALLAALLVGITEVNDRDFFDLHICNVPTNRRPRVGTPLSNTPGGPLPIKRIPRPYV
jgi:hypothetical protein